MKKPAPGDYGVTLGDIERFQAVSRKIGWLEGPPMVAGGLILFLGLIATSASPWWLLLFPLGLVLVCFGKILSWIFLDRAKVRQIGQFQRDSAAYKEYLAAHEQRIQRTKVDFWQSLSGRGFEQELAALFRGNGYDVSLTPISGDLGVDIELRKGDHFAVVQCKAHNQPVGPSAVRELYGTLVAQRADEGILASVSGFTLGARQFALNKPITLMGLQQIIALQSGLNPGGPNAEARRSAGPRR